MTKIAVVDLTQYRCRHCGGNIIRGEDGLECLLCTRAFTLIPRKP